MRVLALMRLFDRLLLLRESWAQSKWLEKREGQLLRVRLYRIMAKHAPELGAEGHCFSRMVYKTSLLIRPCKTFEI
jgi:hypothetical protein